MSTQKEKIVELDVEKINIVDRNGNIRKRTYSPGS